MARAALTLSLLNTRSSPTSTASARTWATGRSGSTLATGSTSNCEASNTTHSVLTAAPSCMATGSTSSVACAAASTERASPLTTSTSSRRTAVNDDSKAKVAIAAPDARSASTFASGSWAEISALAIAEGTTGPGTAPRPNSANTTASSTKPNPCPPTDSARWTPCSPWSAAAAQYGGGVATGVSSAWCSTLDGTIRATRDCTESAKAWCSGVMAMGMTAPFPPAFGPSLLRITDRLENEVTRGIDFHVGAVRPALPSSMAR